MRKDYIKIFVGKILNIADQNFEKAALPLHTLSNYENLLEQALETSYITEDQQETIKEIKKKETM